MTEPTPEPEPTLDTDKHDVSDPKHAAPREDRAPAESPENREQPHG